MLLDLFLYLCEGLVTRALVRQEEVCGGVEGILRLREALRLLQPVHRFVSGFLGSSEHSLLRITLPCPGTVLSPGDAG